MVMEWPVLIAVGIVGGLFTPYRIPFFPVSNIVGFLVFVFAILFHMRCHTVHKQADQESKKIEKLVTTGIFSRIRHPMYSSLILAILGMTIASGVAVMIIPALILSVLTVLTALKEEEFLVLKFGDLYTNYMKEVPYRFIPGVV